MKALVEGGDEMESSVSIDFPENSSRAAVVHWLGVVGGVVLGFVVLWLLSAGTASAETAGEHPERGHAQSGQDADGLLDGLTDHLSDQVLEPVTATLHGVTSTVDNTVSDVSDRVVTPVVRHVTTTVAGALDGSVRPDTPHAKSKPVKPVAQAKQVRDAVVDRDQGPGRVKVSTDTGARSDAAESARVPTGPNLPIAPSTPSTPDGVPGTMTHTASSGSGGGFALGVLTEQVTVIGALPSWRAPPAAVPAPAWWDRFGRNHPS
jgi:hypothetical protein